MHKNSTGNETKQDEHIRSIKPRDRSRIEEMVVSSDRFNQEEIATALELVDEALERGEKSGYLIVVLEVGKEHPPVKGYACYGPTPLTQGAYDLYWIVTDPVVQGKGFGRRLLEYVEKDIVKRGGRMLLIETSSQESYGTTIRFYKRNGYERVARIKDFYRIGDDKLVFSKGLT
ncbi:MAG: GNAT family N-acetyltransferase [Desulfobacterales bacterium]|nr:GNAT family N-acetyltransferase [Desulfobacterales bacterium]